MKRVAAYHPSVTENKAPGRGDAPEISSDLWNHDANIPALAPWPLLVIMAAAFAVVAPFFFFGNPSGHDFEIHLNWWMEVVTQWKQGIVYPRWAGLAQYGYGDPRFIFYPPISWLMGGALGAALPWKVVPGAFTWLALTLSGCSMFLLARRWVGRRGAILTSALFAVNPYYIVIIYFRGAFAELLAGALLPLLLLYLPRAQAEGKRIILPLGFVLAAVWLTNVPAAIMISYSLIFMLGLLAVHSRSLRVLLYGAAALGLGFALAAFYILPVLYERNWISVFQAMSPGLRPIDNFLFTRMGISDHDRFNVMISMLASVEAIALLLCALAWWRTRQNSTLLQKLVLPWGVGCALLMLPFTAWVWSHSPGLNFVQFPWRWLLCLTPALFIVTGLRRPKTRAFIYLLIWGVLALGCVRVQRPLWDDAADIAEMIENQQSGRGYEGLDEYVPGGGDAYEIKPDAPLVNMQNVPAEVRIIQWRPELKSFTVDAQRAGILVLHLFNYPAWKVGVNGCLVSAQSQPGTGQMMVAVARGKSEVSLRFTRTRDRTIGAIISILALLGLAMITGRQRINGGFGGIRRQGAGK